MRARLFHIRWSHLGMDSAEEDAHLDAMDEVWWAMTDEEREMASLEPPMEVANPEPGDFPAIIDVDVSSEPGPVRKAA